MKNNNYIYEFWDFLALPKCKTYFEKVNKISLFIEAMNNYKSIKKFDFFLCTGNIFHDCVRYSGYSDEKIDIDQLIKYLKKYL